MSRTCSTQASLPRRSTTRPLSTQQVDLVFTAHPTQASDPPFSAKPTNMRAELNRLHKPPLGP
jgi:phosphoenolpyruvate carboxylase